MADGGGDLDSIRSAYPIPGAQVRRDLRDVGIERHNVDVRKSPQQVPVEGNKPGVSRLAGSREDLVERQDGRNRPEASRLDLLEQILRAN